MRSLVFYVNFPQLRCCQLNYYKLAPHIPLHTFITMIYIRRCVKLVRVSLVRTLRHQSNIGGQALNLSQKPLLKGEVDLLVKMAGFVKKAFNIKSRRSELDQLVQGGQPYRTFHFSQGSMPYPSKYKVVGSCLSEKKVEMTESGRILLLLFPLCN